MNEAWRDAVLLALSHACSQDPSLIKEAEGKLKAWETEPGFYSLLMVRMEAYLFIKLLQMKIRWPFAVASLT